MSRYNSMFKRLRLTLEMIRFHHSIFALPYAVIGMFMAKKGFPPVTKIILILIAMVSARSSAMIFNRVVDYDVDRINLRTKNWHLPTGKISFQYAGLFITLMIIVFELSASFLNPLAFYLSPIALIIILGYSLTKRFTYLTHIFLGLALGLAPMGSWIGIRGSITLEPIVLMVSVIFWVAGFDILYSLQDYDFDVKMKLHSIPQKFGKEKGIKISRLFHLIYILLLFTLLFFKGYGFGIIYLIGVGIVIITLLYEHSIVSPKDISRINEAFFTANGFASLIFMFFTVLDILV